ncbi:lipoprotein-anchoring transpeptidase ErfK/SrfK [Erythromicrobium ramosum]|jgi:lipoprotein-anchoring transpeptidase ErfK/SrfK|uniref:L,D-transpeptidase family protein n=1 Tax=Erythrobacter ramosus TaxID=35811 RepID=A0A6I4UDQ7_9SPHN|nr:L,D-transpeptidase family protein [Erythrobacter ramosus]MBB3775326.1 lipoprotein-anchoring transpeptidase ErfK/SrfK [Erythrobacter ramosus]MXP37052.1 L,D-transpeptidase family protein [Erythrobacter ramosus]
MIRILAASLVLVATPCVVAAQTTAGQTGDAAEAVAAEATGTFEQVDPDSDLPSADEAAAAYAGLPPLTADEAPAMVAAPALKPEPPRGPAVRMIANEVAQPLPAAAPAPAPAPALTPAALTRNDPFVIKSILPIEGSIRYGDWFWDESAAPRTGKLVITVDLEARVISAFRDGHEIGTAVVLVGTQDHPTPLGSFPILTKEKDNVSEKYNNAPMPHTLRLTWDGIAIHGSPVMNGYASHGCIGVPDEFAAKLFAAAKRGDKVIITRGKMIGIGDKVM